MHSSIILQAWNLHDIFYKMFTKVFSLWLSGILHFQEPEVHFFFSINIYTYSEDFLFNSKQIGGIQLYAISSFSQISWFSF